MHIPLTPIRCLYRAADLYSRKTGVVCGDKRFTYGEFTERCERLATGLAHHGVQPGDRVAYLSFNTHKLLEGYYGVVQAHAIVMPLNVRLSPAELVQILNHSGAAVLMFEKDFAPLVEQFRKVCPSIHRYVALDDARDDALAYAPDAGTSGGDIGYEELLADGHPERTDFMTVDETSAAELFYTSGSTGTPKGVVLSHRTLFLHALQVAATFLPRDTDVELHTIPLFHANGWSRPQTSCLLGLKQVMVRRFDPALVFRLIQNEGATSMSLVPTMANALLMSPELNNYDLSSLKEIHVGGAASSPELIDRLEQAFHCPATAGYGLTETSPVATDGRSKSTLTYRDDAERIHRQAMAGWPIVGVEVRVVTTDPAGVLRDVLRDVPRDMETIGEVVIRGDNVMDGYYREPAATQAVMTGAWFHSGDMAVWDEDGYVHIVDRQKDIIISGGENISSIEVERAIAAHPAVMECAVVSAPDERWGEVPIAFVVRKPGETLTHDVLTEFLGTRLARFKVPRAWYFVAEALPKTGTGKILKRELREQFWKDKAERVQG